jgi:hypothetical protein
MPLLEELFEAPILKQDELDHEVATLLKNYVPPTLLPQLEASLSAELGRHIVKTDWDAYRDPLKDAQYEQIARMLQYTLATIRRATGKSGMEKPPASTGSASLKWLQQECDLLVQEMETGNTKRWEEARKLVGPKWRRMSKSQRDALTPSVMLLAKNAYMHPIVKRRILDQISAVIIATIKDDNPK